MPDTTRRQRILITAFEPFGGRSRNASAEAVDLLSMHLTDFAPSVEIILRLLPVATGIASDQIRAYLDEIQPDILLSLGEAKRDAICLETTGYNERKFTIPDNNGQMLNGAIHPDRPISHKSTLPLAEMLTAIESTGVAVRYSDDAGRYLCNEVLYSALDYIETRNLATRAGFIHVPLLPDTIQQVDDPSMTTEQVVKVILATLQCLTEINSQTA